MKRPESDSDEYETDTDVSEEEEDEQEGVMLKPVFIPRNHRLTIKEQGKKRAH